jgi:hypothetical protein
VYDDIADEIDLGSHLKKLKPRKSLLAMIIAIFARDSS